MHHASSKPPPSARRARRNLNMIFKSEIVCVSIWLSQSYFSRSAYSTSSHLKQLVRRLKELRSGRPLALACSADRDLGRPP